MRVTNIRMECNQGAYRVCADVEGAPLWFESSNMKLRPVPEAFGCALLLPALFCGVPLSIEGQVSRAWLSNIENLLDIFHEWWDYPKLMPQVAFGPTLPKAATGKTALCFSGGVDSFFTLLRSNHKIDLLVTLHGYDIQLQDVTRMSAFEASLRSIAAEMGVKSVIIRTNLRAHPAFEKAPWEHTHGGALAAVGHLLSDSIDRLLISSSYAYRNQRPWGSHFKTDPWWSSDRLQVVHTGAETGRSDKLRTIAGEPLVRQHMRVCWENLASHGNCSRCEKCIRSRLVLAECGELGNFPVFEGEETLVQQINALRFIKGVRGGFMKTLDRGRLQPDVEQALRKLIKRTRSQRFRVYLAGNTIRKVFSWASNQLR